MTYPKGKRQESHCTLHVDDISIPFAFPRLDVTERRFQLALESHAMEKFLQISLLIHKNFAMQFCFRHLDSCFYAAEFQ